MKICLDPGHSGPFEPGACAGGYSEADLNLTIAKTLRTLLEAAGHRCILTRSGSIGNDDLTWRADVAWDFDAVIFVSLHCNAFADSAACGTEILYYPGSNYGYRLARLIQTGIIRACHTVDRGVKPRGDLTVLKATACPAVLVELAFLTNQADRDKLTSPIWQLQFCQGILAGVNEFERGLTASGTAKL